MTRSLRNRRGAILVLAAFVMVVVLGMLVVVVDISRMYTQKNELQTAADAGALAGVYELLTGMPEVTVKDSAVSFGEKNTVLKQAIDISPADVVCGVWDEETKTYQGTLPNVARGENTVAVTARGAANYTFPLFMGGNKTLVATARAFAANVGTTTCVKPWAIAYARLTRTLQPSNTDSLRPLDTMDLRLLSSLPIPERTFVLKIGAPPESGNFGSLRIPDADDPDSKGNQENLYKDNIVDCNSTPIGPGTILFTEPGVKSGPTVDGVKQFCAKNGRYEDSTGNCYDTNNELGITVKAALWSQPTKKVAEYTRLKSAK